MASRTSSALPTVRPSGASMSVSKAVIVRPARWPTSSSEAPSARASSSVFMKAPRPTLRSMTSASRPSASFFARIEAVMSGMDSTVAVTSRSA